MALVDTSVAALVVADRDRHKATFSATPPGAGPTGHAAFETFSALT